MHDNFIAVARPQPTEGVGRALQSAFSGELDVPTEWNDRLARLDRVTD